MERTDKRGLILDSARAMFNKFGYKKTTIDEVVREVGVAKGTFYLYFKSKDELFVETFRAIRDEMMEEYYQYIGKSDTAAGKLEGTLRFALESLDRHPLFARITAKDEEFRAALTLTDDPSNEKLMKGNVNQFTEIFQQGIDDGDLRKEIDTTAIPVVFGLLKMMHFYKDLGKMFNLSKEQFNDAVIDLAMHGILKK